MRKETGESELEIETETASAGGRDEDEEGRPPNDGSDHYSRGCTAQCDPLINDETFRGGLPVWFTLWCITPKFEDAFFFSSSV